MRGVLALNGRARRVVLSLPELAGERTSRVEEDRTFLSHDRARSLRASQPAKPSTFTLRSDCSGLFHTRIPRNQASTPLLTLDSLGHPANDRRTHIRKSLASMLSGRLVLSAALQLLLFTGARAEDCGTLTRMKLGHVAIRSAQMVPAGSASTPVAGDEIPVAKTIFAVFREHLSRPPILKSVSSYGFRRPARGMGSSNR